MEILFKGPLNGVADAVKSIYVTYWSGDHGMDLVDKWTTEGKINDGNQGNSEDTTGTGLTSMYTLKPTS